MATWEIDVYKRQTIYAAIMFYFLLGEILNNMGIGDKLVDFLKSLVGHIPGS